MAFIALNVHQRNEINSKISSNLCIIYCYLKLSKLDFIEKQSIYNYVYNILCFYECINIYSFIYIYNDILVRQYLKCLFHSIFSEYCIAANLLRYLSGKK